MNRYLIQFVLRPDTHNYEKTDLREWVKIIGKSIEYFNERGGRFNDERHLDLVEVNPKDFYVELQIRRYWNKDKPSFYNRVGALSRYLKQNGMDILASPHGKVFSLEVKNKEIDPETKQRLKERKAKKKLLTQAELNIYIDHKKKTIMIPKEFMDDYCIKFFEPQEENEDLINMAATKN